MHARDGLLHQLHRAAEVRAFEAPGYGDQLLQVLPADFVLRRQLLDLRERSEGRGAAGAAVEDRILNRVEGLPRFISQAYSNGVRPAVCNRRIGGRDAVEEGGG